ncbi:MAG TPA: dipeptidase [Opitutaceae bacterium]
MNFLRSFLASLALGSAATAADDARAIHERALALDTHFDTAASLVRPGWSIMDRHAYAEDYTQVDYPRLLEGGIDGGFWAIYVGQGPRTPEGHAAARDTALQIAVRIREMVARHSAHFALATKAGDAERIVASGRQVVYLSIENGYPIGHDLSLVKTFHDLGVRMLGPVHFANNELGDSATDPKGAEWHGLSPLGKQLVAECNRLGIVLDASHSSDEVLRQMLELSATPIVLSHSGCKAVYDHPRNIGDDLLRALAARGGVIQMNAFSSYVAALPQAPERNAATRALFAKFGGRAGLTTPERYAEFLRERAEVERAHPMPLATFDQFMAHVLHALEIVGPDHIGISGDFDGGGGVEGFMDVTGAPRITARLLEAGYTEADVAKIWGGNVLRLLRTAETHAAHAVAAPASP